MNNSEEILKIYPKLDFKLSYIKKFNVKAFSKLLLKFYHKYFQEFKIKDIESKIDKNVNNFFNLLNTTEFDKHKILSIVNYQYLIAKYYITLLGHLTKDDHNDHSELLNASNIISNSNDSIILKKNKKINNFIKTFLTKSRIDIETKKEEKSEEEEPLSEEYKILSKSIVNILTDVLKNNNNILCYGSYTGYTLNKKIKFNDIDVYYTYAYQFLTTLMAVVYLILDIETEVFSIPLISNHFSLLIKNNTKNVELLDCVYQEPNIIKSIKKINLKNINFIHPTLQMLNNIRMNVEIHKISKINENMESNIQKYETLLNYSITTDKKIILPNVDEESKKISDIVDYEITDSYILFKNLLKNVYFVVVLTSVNTFVDFLNNKKGLYSRRYYAFLDELFFEMNTKASNDKPSLKNVLLAKVKEIDIITQEIVKDESESKNDLEKLYDKYKDKKIIFFTNTSTTLYFKNLEDNKIEISIRNIQSFIATCSLYLFLHNYSIQATEIFNILLKTLIADNNEILSEFNKKLRLKKKGRHTVLNIKKLIYNNVNVNKPTELDYLSQDQIYEYLGNLL